jgi:hypothetical protein
MHGAQHPERVALRELRHATIERLSEAFAQDELGLDEFERRVDAAFDARSLADLDRLVADLGRALTPSAVPEIARSGDTGAGPLVLHDSQVRPIRVALAVLGTTERRGRWSLPRSARVVAVFGNVELDLREVVLPAGVTELFVRALFGNVELTVSPHLAVEASGTAVLGSFSSVSRVPAEPGDEPILRVIGSSVFGNVEIHTRPVGNRDLPRLSAVRGG